MFFISGDIHPFSPQTRFRLFQNGSSLLVSFRILTRNFPRRKSANVILTVYLCDPFAVRISLMRKLLGLRYPRTMFCWCKHSRPFVLCSKMDLAVKDFSMAILSSRFFRLWCSKTGSKRSATEHKHSSVAIYLINWTKINLSLPKFRIEDTYKKGFTASHS